jgi:hypothetical protein
VIVAVELGLVEPDHADEVVLLDAAEQAGDLAGLRGAGARGGLGDQLPFICGPNPMTTGEPNARTEAASERR